MEGAENGENRENNGPFFGKRGQERLLQIIQRNDERFRKALQHKHLGERINSLLGEGMEKKGNGGYEKATARPLFEFRKRKKVAFYWDQRKRGLSRMPFINIPQSRYIAVLDIPGYAFLARFSSHSQVY